jgi:hypothetical protein
MEINKIFTNQTFWGYGLYQYALFSEAGILCEKQKKVIRRMFGRRKEDVGI